MVNPLFAAILDSLNAHIDARIKAALEQHKAEVDWEKLQSAVTKEVERAMQEHTSEFDHEEYDRVVREVDDADLVEEIKDVINDTTWNISAR